MELEHTAIASLVLVLGVAALWDVCVRRIPNWLCVCATVSGLIHAALQSGAAGQMVAIGGMAIGFTAMMMLYLSRIIAAGDVKLITAVGSYLGPLGTAHAVLYTLAAGAVLATGYLLWRRQKHARSWSGLRRTAPLHDHPTRDGRPNNSQMPFAPAILVGSIAAALCPPLLA